MAQVIIENPILNSPFEEPKRHFRFSDEGITNEIVEARRVSSYFIPIAKPKKKGKAKEEKVLHRWALPGETEVLGVLFFSHWFKCFTSPSRVGSLSCNRANGIPPSSQGISILEPLIARLRMLSASRHDELVNIFPQVG